MNRSSLITVVAVVAVLLLAMATNPSAERHRVKIRESMGERNPVARAVGVGALAAFASGYHSLGVASYTTVGNRIVSWGAFGLVFVKP